MHFARLKFRNWPKNKFFFWESKNCSQILIGEEYRISPNSFSSRQIAPRALPVKHNRQEPAQVAPYLVLTVFICH